MFWLPSSFMYIISHIHLVKYLLQPSANSSAPYPYSSCSKELCFCPDSLTRQTFSAFHLSLFLEVYFDPTCAKEWWLLPTFQLLLWSPVCLKFSNLFVPAKFKRTLPLAKFIDCQYGFSQGFSICYQTLQSELFSSSLRDFHESLIVVLKISKAYDRIWYKALICKLLSFGFYLSPCAYIVNLISSHTIDAVDCSFPKHINSGFPHGSVLSQILFLLFINNHFSCTSSPIYFYANDSTLHYSMRFDDCPSQ